MSVATKTALVGLLQADATLAAMLAVDSHPNSGGRPAIYGTWRGESPNDIPQLIVKQADVRPDPTEERSGYVYHETWHFQAWAYSTSDIHTQIIERVQQLLHEKQFTLSGGRNLKYVQLLSSVPDGIDTDMRQAFALQVYELVYSIP